MERQLIHKPYFCLLFQLRPCFLHTTNVKESLYGILSSVIFRKCIDSEFVNRCVCLPTQNTPKTVIFFCQYWRFYNTREHLLVGSWVPSVNGNILHCGFNFLPLNNFMLTNLLLFISISVPLNILNTLLFQSTYLLVFWNKCQKMNIVYPKTFGYFVALPCQHLLSYKGLNITNHKHIKWKAPTSNLRPRLPKFFGGY